MIVTCPNCQTRYRVEDTELGAAAERRMRCASCGHLWRYSIAGAASRPAAIEATPQAKPETRAAVPPVRQVTATPAGAPIRFDPEDDPGRFPGGPAAQPRPSVAVEAPPAARRGVQRTFGLSLGVLGVGFVVVAILARDVIVTAFPPAAPLYETLHLVAPAAAGLEIAVTPPDRTSDSLAINGDIVNHGATAQAVPRLRVTLRDGGDNYLDSRVIDPPVAQLQPGATAHFNAVFEHPSITAVGADVSFATE